MGSSSGCGEKKPTLCPLPVLLVEPKLWHKIAHEMGMDSAVCEGMREILQNGDGIYKNGGLRYLLSIDID